MYSVIIPTMWIPHTVGKLISDLNSNQLVSEIIIIDNSEGKRKISLEKYEKVIHIIEKENTYVNPAWNKGVFKAKENKLVIVNDDVNTDWSILEKVKDRITPTIGMIGLSKSAYLRENKNKEVFNITPISSRTLGYGCLFFIHKNSYTPIPNNLKIHYGDDFLFYNTGKPNYQIEGWPVYGLLSQTVNFLKAKKIIEQDKKEWKMLKMQTI